MEGRIPVLIVGAGHAGLAMSYLLKERRVEHLLLEKHRIGHAWREARWDSFCLVTPNWQCQLPGFPYAGDDPEGFMDREEIIAYLDAYAASFGPPVEEGVEALELKVCGDGFELNTARGRLTAEQVVVATGGYQRPSIPRLAERFPENIVQLHTSEYRNPESLPAGDVLVVGTGQSGCQIAEDLHLAGRRVHLAVGGAPRAPRVYRGKDVVEWLDRMGYYDLPIDKHPKKDTVRSKTNHYVTGRDGGREIDLRCFALEGMQLYGRLTDIRSGRLHFGDDLVRNLDHADEVADSIRKSIDDYIAREGLDAPAAPEPEKVWAPTRMVREVALEDSEIPAVIWATGYGSDFSWVDVPVFDGRGYPGHHRGVTAQPGLYFLGLPWLYTWGSGRFSGVGRDATFLADRICAAMRAPRQPAAALNDVAIGS